MFFLSKRDLHNLYVVVQFFFQFKFFNQFKFFGTSSNVLEPVQIF